jgi:hypothetical protein
MPKSHQTERLPAGLRLGVSPAVRVGLELPKTLSQRVDAVVVELAGRGESTNRREVIAAAILAVTEDVSSMAPLIHRFRQATVGDVIAPGEDGQIEITHSGPGPRKRTR